MSSIERLARIHLIKEAEKVSADEIRFRFPSSVCVCDLYITHAERGDEEPWGYRIGNILNIDHHAPVPKWERRISSANLAVQHVTELGLPAGPVVINHRLR